MKAILLCAGYATRLHPLTQDQPKPLLPVGGRPILDYLLEKIGAFPSVDRVFLVTNNKFTPHFQKWALGKRCRWEVEVVNDGTKTNETRLGAIGDLAFVLQKFRLDDDLGVFAGDNLFLSDLADFVSFAESHRPHTSLGVVDVGRKELASKYGIVCMNAENQITQFLEKPEAPPSTLASTGAYWFPKERLNFLDRYIHNGHNADQPGNYIRWLVQVDRVYAYPLRGKWFDIGDLASYREADQLLHQMKKNQNRKEPNEGPIS